MHPRNARKWTYVVFFLIAVGLLYQFVLNPGGMIIPLAVFGVVFFLYKFPPARLRRELDKFTRSRGTKPGGQASRKAKFRVIRGNKKDDEPPRYH